MVVQKEYVIKKEKYILKKQKKKKLSIFGIIKYYLIWINILPNPFMGIKKNEEILFISVKLMEGQISKIRFSKCILIKSPFF